jgi:hypothetical protein
MSHWQTPKATHGPEFRTFPASGEALPKMDEAFGKEASANAFLEGLVLYYVRKLAVFGIPPDSLGALCRCQLERL